MDTRCSVCRHPQCKEIEDKLLLKEISLRQAAREYGLHRTQIRRHMMSHTSYQPTAPLPQEWEPPRPNPPSRVRTVERVESLGQRVERVIDAAEDRGNPDLMLRASRELRQTLELTARLTGETRAAETGGGRETVTVRFRNFGPDAATRPFVGEATLPAAHPVIDAEEVVPLLPPGDDESPL